MVIPPKKTFPMSETRREEVDTAIFAAQGALRSAQWAYKTFIDAPNRPGAAAALAQLEAAKARLQRLEDERDGLAD